MKNINEDIHLDGFLEEFREALKCEIDVIKKTGLSRIILFNGRKIENNNDNWYKYNIEYLPNIPSDTPCKLIIDGEYYDASVIGFDEDSITIRCAKELPNNFSRASLENGSYILMEKLIERIEANKDAKNTIGNYLLNNHECATERIYYCNDVVFNSDINEEQQKAIISSLNNNQTYIWGPPGTGKTQVITKIIEELYRRNRNVLLLSHTNTAVDEALNRVISNFKGIINDDRFPILRLGFTDKIDEKATLNSHIRILGKDLLIEKTSLESKYEKCEKEIQKIKIELSKFDWIEKNNISTLSLKKEQIDESSEEKEKIENELKKQKDSLEITRKENPLSNEYFRLTGKIGNLIQKKNRIEIDYNRIKDIYDNNESRISILKDELKKNNKYNELNEKESSYFSTLYYEELINSINKEILDIEEFICSLNKEYETNKQIIDVFDQKSSLSKLFGNTKFIKAKTRNNDIESEIRERKELLIIKKELLNKNKEDLRAVKTLIEIKKEVTPKFSIDFCNEKIIQYESDFEKAKIEFPKIQNEFLSISKEINKLQEETDKSKTQYKVVFSIETNINKLEERKKDIIGRIDYLKNQYNRLFESEKNYCVIFSNIKIESFEDIIDEFYRISNEIKTINKNELENNYSNSLNEIKNISIKLSEVNEKLSCMEQEAINNAKIIGTTLTKSYLDDNLIKRKFDTLIIDEASMASIPALWCASLLSEKSIIIVGDFMQLPPIVISDKEIAKKWLGKSIYYHSRVEERLKNRVDCANFIMLKKQYRMLSEIADISNQYYYEYGSKLESDDNAELIVDAYDEFIKWYPFKDKNPIRLIDTKDLNAWVTGISTGRNKNSRLNSFSAALTVDLAFKCLEKYIYEKQELYGKPKVLIIAPYKPHVTKIRKIIEHEYEIRNIDKDCNLIKTGTIHSFQGSEADIVIFDFVVDEPHWRCNLFMPGESDISKELKNMFNVAITRAKFKLFVVGNYEYCINKAKDNSFGQLLDYLVNKKRYQLENAKELFPKLIFSNRESVAEISIDDSKHLICNESDFTKYFEHDINDIKENMIIYSPFMSSNRISKLLPYFSDVIERNKKIIIITKTIDERNKKDRELYLRIENKLAEIGIKIIHKKGMHEKLCIIDNEIVWLGSLNILSYNENTGEIMERRKNEVLALEFIKDYNLDSIFEINENNIISICPCCGNEMIVAEGDAGGIYWKCSICDYTRDIKQAYPYDGEIKCKCCDSPYKFNMVNKPRWICTSDAKHYQYLKKSDLMLIKMKNKLTKKDYTSVMKYFNSLEKSK